VSYSFTTASNKSVTVTNQPLQGDHEATGRLYQSLSANPAPTPTILYDMGNPSKCVLKDAAEMGANANVAFIKAILYPAIFVMLFCAMGPAIMGESAIMAIISLAISMAGTCYALAQREKINNMLDLNARCYGRPMEVKVASM
jgi:hypothetical protein